MTQEEREHVNQILTQQVPLNVDEAFLVDLVGRQDVEINDIMLQKMNAVREAQNNLFVEYKKNQLAIAALLTVLARIKGTTAADWLDSTKEWSREAYEGRLEDWLEQTIAGLES